MTTIVVEFDGTNFVPEHPVDLPVGTKGTIAIPTATASANSSNPANVASDSEWQEILAQIRAVQPDPSTVEETMRQIRTRMGLQMQVHDDSDTAGSPSKEAFMRDLHESEPYFPTVEAAIGYSRKYPGFYP